MNCYCFISCFRFAFGSLAGPYVQKVFGKLSSKLFLLHFSVGERDGRHIVGADGIDEQKLRTNKFASFISYKCLFEEVCRKGRRARKGEKNNRLLCMSSIGFFISLMCHISNTFRTTLGTYNFHKSRKKDEKFCANLHVLVDAQ